MSDVTVDDFLHELEELSDDQRFNWATTTITGIRDTVERTQRVTPGQYIAISNIRKSVEQRESKAGWSRRYEGHGR